MSDRAYRVVYGAYAGLDAAEVQFPGVTRCLPSVEQQFGDGFPVLVDADGLPVEESLAFLVSRVGASTSTLAQYARALMGFVEFLGYRGDARLLDAAPRDLTAYRLYRTRTGESPVSEYSFRVEASALRQFYAWAVETGLLERSPVKQLSRNGWDNLSTNRMRHSKIRHVDKFLYEALLRAAAQGSVDAGVRSASLRNVAAIKTFAATGLRLGELASLLTFDIDHAVRLRRALSVEMESITKYRVNRNALIPFYATDAIRRYRKLERPNVVVRHQRALGKRLDSLFVISDFNESTRRVSGRWRGRRHQYLLHLVPVELRLKAVSVNSNGSVEPLCLFLSDSRGQGMTRSGWEGVFSEVSDQMMRQDPTDGRIRKVTPHDLRHTFAINYLRAAHGERAKVLQETPFKDGPPLRDPLIDLQELLGHATAAQTMRYLRYVEDIDRLIASAVPGQGDAGGGEHAPQK